MALDGCIDKVVGTIAPLAVTAVVAAATGGASLSMFAEPIAAGLVGATALAAHFRSRRNSDCAKAFDRVCKRLKTELESKADHRMDPQLAEQVFEEVERLLPPLRPSPEDLVSKWRLDPVRIGAGMRERFAAESPLVRYSEDARWLVGEIVERTVACVKDDPFFAEQLRPAIDRQLLADVEPIQAIHANVEELRHTVNLMRREFTSVLERLPAETRSEPILPDIGGSSTSMAQEHGKYPIVGARGDPGVKASPAGHRRSVEKAISETKDLVARNLLEEAQASIEEALTEADLPNDDRHSLLSVALDVDMASRQFESAAKRAVEIVDLGAAGRPQEELFDALLIRQRDLINRGLAEGGLSAKVHVAHELSAVIAGRVKTRGQYRKAVTAIMRAASAAGGQRRDMLFTASIIRVVVYFIRGAVIGDLVALYHKSRPWGAGDQFIELAGRYLPTIRYDLTSKDIPAVKNYERWEIACFAHPDAHGEERRWYPGILQSVLRLAVLKAFEDGIGRENLPADFAEFVLSDPKAGKVIIESYLTKLDDKGTHNGPMIRRFIDTFLLHYRLARETFARTDALLAEAHSVAAEDGSRDAAELQEWMGRLNCDAFWYDGDESRLEVAERSIAKAIEGYHPLHDLQAIVDLEVLLGEIREIRTRVVADAPVG